jgi:alginate O-acetyltransferase complex protein AlgI
MLFPTTDFAIFFVLVFLGHWLLHPNPRLWKPFMIGASYVFYAWWDWRFVFLLGGVSALAQLGAVGVSRFEHPRSRRIATGVAVAAILAPLAWFKYYGFFAVSVTNVFASAGIHASPPLVQVILPVGISFFTFMAVSYVVDVSRGDAPVAGTVDALLYLSLFPHLVAGPIVRPNELIPQFRTELDARRIDVAGAAWLILGGLFKKVVIASYLTTTIVDPVFGDPVRHSAVEVLFGIVGFAVVIYADFSGYTDIAIGVARLLGFRFPQNFDRPYSARSIGEFWRRWHMTLSRWLRDYLYIPLGGNQRGARRTYVNLLLTMLLGGLWHGADWTFVVWGAYHGALLCAERLRARRRRAHQLGPVVETGLRVWGERASTFALVCVGWVFFRADSMHTALSLLGRLATGWTTPTRLVQPQVLGIIAMMLALQYAGPTLGDALKDRLAGLRPATFGAVAGIALMIIATMGPHGVAPFIYFQF